MITFKRLDPDNIPWNEIEECEGANVFHTHRWFTFLEKSQGLLPVVAEINEGSVNLGYFIGSISHKFGLKILGSPFRGWNTDVMGFDLHKGVSYHEVLKAFPSFAFRTLHCHYLEIIDPKVCMEDLIGLRYRTQSMTIYSFDLSKSLEDLLAAMDHDRRGNIRKSSERGVVVKVVQEMQFAEEYYVQLEDVFAKQSLDTPFPLSRVQQILEQFLDSPNISLIRACNPEGKSIATQIDLAFNNVVFGWGAASLREFQILRPNEACNWYCIQYWKKLGMKEYRIGGGWSQYKKSYGCNRVPQIRLMLGRDPLMDKFMQIMFSINSPKLRNWTIKHLKG